MSNTYASGAQNVGVRLLDNAEANITLGTASEVALLAGSTTQTLHFKAQMEVLTAKRQLQARLKPPLTTCWHINKLYQNTSLPTGILCQSAFLFILSNRMMKYKLKS
jgi:hypothetical protein